ncbi:MAG: hypothetical protein ACAI44_25455 [Candidatus Sericytochromatia bacterium]
MKDFHSLGKLWTLVLRESQFLLQLFLAFAISFSGVQLFRILVGSPSGQGNDSIRVMMPIKVSPLLPGKI